MNESLEKQWSQTPITDEAELTILDIQNGHGTSPYVSAEVARRLERALRDARAVTHTLQPCDRLRAALHDMGTHSPTLLEVLGEHLSTAQAEKVLQLTQRTSNPDSKDGQNG